MEDHSNRTRLAKLLRFYSSNSDKEMTSLAEYIERMKEKQDAIYFMAGTSRKEVTIKHCFHPIYDQVVNNVWSNLYNLFLYSQGKHNFRFRKLKDEWC